MTCGKGIMPKCHFCGGQQYIGDKHCRHCGVLHSTPWPQPASAPVQPMQSEHAEIQYRYGELIPDGAHYYTFRNHSRDYKSFTLWKEGNMFMALCGPNIQEGYCAFGETLEEAVANFLKEYEYGK